MGQLITIESFLLSLKKAGILIKNEKELHSRLTEVYQWQYALRTLAANGTPLGIQFVDAGMNKRAVHRAFARAHIPSEIETVVVASIKQ